MQIPKSVIEFSIEGGWKGRYPSLPWKAHQDGVEYLVHETIIFVEWYAIALDPTFWQTLGKALGWRTGMTFADIFDGRELSGWEYHAHRFYDLILTGKPTDNFWKEILN